ncbi:MAG: hypothetical protein IT215_06245 [Chitinophagaceae bacterium]|nr:MAG: hypothetical protein UZ11_BCD004000716 [Bacteroidetes bacterium OLB11]MCC6448267.1 hypothetical protein [Chitinophagaceae bacterium]HMN32585.1 hypothetical protein [Chitinophagaceae bacterium]
MTFKSSLLVLIATTIFILIIEYIVCQFISNFNFNTLLIGTVFLAAIHILSLAITFKASKNKNAYQFVSGVTVSTIVKLFLTIIGAGIYIYINRLNLNKIDLFFLMPVYLIFLFTEAYIASRFAKINA